MRGGGKASKGHTLLLEGLGQIDGKPQAKKHKWEIMFGRPTG